MKISHKLRLALTAGLASGALLGALFYGVVSMVRTNAQQEGFEDLRLALKAFADNGDKRFALADFRKLNPEIAVTVYEHNGAFPRSDGPIMAPVVQGPVQKGERLLYGMPVKDVFVVASVSAEDVERPASALGWALAGLWGPLVFLVGAATWLAARAVFRPLESLNAQATAISGTDLSLRLQAQDSAEFGVFAQGLNQMLDRIEETVAREERFAADAAHELRTPLAIMRMRVETIMLQSRTPAEYEASNQLLLDEIDRLSRVVNALLRSAQPSTHTDDPLDIGEMTSSIADEWRPRFAEKQVQLHVEPVPSPVAIGAEEYRVVLDNILDNALRFSPEGSEVKISLSSSDGLVILVAEDEGPGAPPDLLESIFDRFVRADDHRNRQSGGAGIGLAATKRIVVHHGGTVRFENREPSGGRIVCELPRA